MATLIVGLVAALVMWWTSTAQIVTRIAFLAVVCCILLLFVKIVFRPSAEAHLFGRLEAWGFAIIVDGAIVGALISTVAR